MKKIVLNLVTLLAVTFVCAQSLEISNYPIQRVDLRQVQLTDCFWLPKIRQIQQVTIPFALQKCEENGRFENFLTAEKVMKGGTGKVLGKMPFDDTDPYKIIEGAALTLVSSPDSNLAALLDKYIAIIGRGQEADGYLTTWRTINPTQAPAKWVGECRQRWDHLEMSHELYNSGHLFEAAATHYYATGKRNLLNIALKNADLLVKVFGAPKNYGIPGHEIVETGLIKLYLITRNQDYFDLAKKFVDLRGTSDHRKPRGEYWQDHQPVLEQDEVVGHAVRAVYFYAGITDIAAITGNEKYKTTARKLWQNMVHQKMYVTGGIGAKHEGEAFAENYDLPNLSAYNETCAAIGGVMWADRMFRSFGNAGFYNVLERMLYNGVLPGISLDGKAFFYPNPLESDGVYKFNQGNLTRAGWFDCPCCPTNLIRFLPSIPALLYGIDKKSIYVNLFAANKAQIRFNNTDVNIVQKTQYPYGATVKLEVNPGNKVKFDLKVRVPDWATDKTASALYTYKNPLSQGIVVNVNSTQQNCRVHDGYIIIEKEWEKGDQVEIRFPFEVRRVLSSALVMENKGKTAIQCGPLLYCMEAVDNPETFDQPFDAEKFEVAYHPDQLGGINKIIAKDGSQHSWNLIPYYAWSNRGVGKMKVWLKTE